MLPNNPMGTKFTASFLISQKCQHNVALWLIPNPKPPPHHRKDHRTHVLHIDRPAAPNHPISNLTRKRSNTPISGYRRHHIQMAMHKKSRTTRIRTSYPTNHTGAPWRRFKYLSHHTSTFKQQRDKLRSRPLIGAINTTKIRSIETNKITTNTNNFTTRCFCGLLIAQDLLLRI